MNKFITHCGIKPLFNRLIKEIITAKQKVFFDKSEVVVQYNNGQFMTDAVIHASKIARVAFTIKKVGLFKRPVKTITINAGTIPTRKYNEKRAKKYFKGYIDGFRKFCDINRVTLYDKFK